MSSGGAGSAAVFRLRKQAPQSAVQEEDRSDIGFHHHGAGNLSEVRLHAKAHCSSKRLCEERSDEDSMGEWIATESEARLRLLKPLNLETTMLLDHPSDG
ncbi:hypothetical protein, partial [Bradyrhizobium sp.]|uniref:hypothetical protein n=1 Tax=Bradyrhizobium sp. TaxID=376 RepID=UPI0040379F64